jgi:threonine dehydratase
MTTPTFKNIEEAHLRIKDYITNTPVLKFELLDKELGANIFLKMDSMQRTKAFKERGAYNSILAYKEEHGHFPEKIVVQSSGNHAQAVASAAQKFGIKALVYMIEASSPLKIQKTKDFGAEVILCKERSEVNRLANEKATKEGYHLIHPASGEHTIAGQGTACSEALKEIGEVEAIFAPCGGGGLISGTYLAASQLSKNSKVYACEPAAANDVARSFRSGKIVGYDKVPNTIADGARTLATTEQTFEILKKIEDVLEISEAKIQYWYDKFYELTNNKIELTSALAIAGVEQFLENNPDKKDTKILVMISGGNTI